MITGKPVTVLRYITDRYGDRVLQSQHTVSRCAFAPRAANAVAGGAELADRASTVTADAELYVPYGADIVPTDVIKLHDGTAWEVVGPIERWQSPFAGAWSPGAVVPLQRMTG
jgi:hypothetical protein